MKSALIILNCKKENITEHCLKVCLSDSLGHFEHFSKVIIRIVARLDTPFGKDIRQKNNVANCHDGDGKRSKNRSKQEDQYFLSSGGVLCTIINCSHAYIPQGHREAHDTKDDGAPDAVPIIDEGFPIVNIRPNVKQEQNKVWLIEM